MLVVVKGAGDIASGIAVRLLRAGFNVVMTEQPEPTAIRRTVSFSDAVRQKRADVEEAIGLRADDPHMALWAVAHGHVAVLVDPEGQCVESLQPDVVVDAILAKRNTGTSITDAPIVIGVGPGFCAGHDCHAVIETKRGHSLGRVIHEGSAIANTGVPGTISGVSEERLLRAPADGMFATQRRIGEHVEEGETIADVEGAPMKARISGVLRGLLPHGTRVHRGMKAGDIDPRDDPSYCETVSDKALAVGGGVLEAILQESRVLYERLPGNWSPAFVEPGTTEHSS